MKTNWKIILVIVLLFYSMCTIAQHRKYKEYDNFFLNHYLDEFHSEIMAVFEKADKIDKYVTLNKSDKFLRILDTINNVSYTYFSNYGNSYTYFSNYGNPSTLLLKQINDDDYHYHYENFLSKPYKLKYVDILITIKERHHKERVNKFMKKESLNKFLNEL